MNSRASLSSETELEDELPVGHLLGDRYRIEARIGFGGIGIVYRASQLPLERQVAIKVLHDELLSMAELRARFEREARALSALTHPNVVSISDYGIAGERPFLVMELLEGRTLEKVIVQGDLEPELAIRFGRELLKGLAFAHSKGIVHRDLKPANVFLQELHDGLHVKLLDFGLARMLDPNQDPESGEGLTRRGVVFGTPAYMSPEQASGTPADVRADVYSCGVLLFEMLTGKRPFGGKTRAQLLRAHLTEAVPQLSESCPGLSVRPELQALLEKAMEKEPVDRHANASELLAALDAIPAPAAWRKEADEEPSASEGELSSGALPVEPSEPSGENAEGSNGGLAGRWFVLGVGLALAAVGGLVGTTLWLADRPDAAVSHSAGAERPRSPRLGASDDERSEAYDPFARPLPEPLRPYLDLVDRGHVFAHPREIRGLYALAAEMPGDPRPLLLLGHLFFAKGWYTESIRRYQGAVHLDPAVRGDPRMLRALVELVTREAVSEAAAETIEGVYGAEALVAVEGAVTEFEGQPLAQLRLVRLRERLQAED